MKLILGAASVLALALFVLPVSAEDAPAVDPAPAAQQEVAPAVEVAALVVPDAVLKLLADGRAASELSIEELNRRAKEAGRFAQDEALPQDLRDQLKSIADAAIGELQTRKQAAEAEKAAKEQAAADQAAKEQAAAEKAAANQAAKEQAAAIQAAKEQAAAERDAADQAAKEQAAAEKAAANQAAKEQAAADSAAKEQAAADKKAAEQTAKEQAAADRAAKEQAAAENKAADQAAKEQAAADNAAKEQAAAENTAADQAAKIEALAAKAAKEQAAAEKAAADQAAKDQAAAQPAPAPQLPVAEVAPVAPVAEPPAPVVAEAPPPKLIIAPPPPPKEVPPPPPPPPESKPLPQVAVVAPPPVAVAAPSVADSKALDNNAGDPVAEKQAQTYLADKSDVSKLSDDDFRKRLDAIRDLMTANELSRDTERAVREKLKGERDILRQRIAQVEAAKQLKDAQANAINPPAAVVVPGVAPAPTTTTNNTTNITNNTTNIITVLTPPQQVLRDRRPSERLDVSELQIRIQIFGQAQSNTAYDPSYRDYWRASVERDRAFLRRRMIEERHRREAYLAEQAAQDTIDIQISNDYEPSRRPRRDVFAAEIDDAEMEDVLVAAPRRSDAGLQQRYRVDEIAVQPKLRDSISRIEIDTIRFGYNEAFIRDEQVGNLDGIAAIIEKIVKKYPNEVFLIEGHTDAPGSAAYNAKLSKLRAESIKKALVSYYVIPGRNLRTVGLGERFLKIPTADAEPENRRVSIARITSLLSQR